VVERVGAFTRSRILGLGSILSINQRSLFDDSFTLSHLGIYKLAMIMHAGVESFVAIIIEQCTYQSPTLLHVWFHSRV
jgi:hypothetical protein